MKKIILLIIVNLLISGTSFSQVKVKIQLTNRHYESGLFAWDVMAVIPSGQNWRVGSSNIRIDFYTVPTGHLTVHPDAAVSGVLTCLNSGNYTNMTTTSINGGTAISLNITRLASCCTLTTGSYLLGRVRYNIVDTTGCTHDTIRYTSVIQDSITALVYGTTWGRINPAGLDSCALLTGISSNNNNIPLSFKLYDNYPNPFNPSTQIKFEIPNRAFVKIKVYNVLGKEIAVLVNGYKTAGEYSVTFNGDSFASGVYFYKIEADNFTDVKKMVLVK